MTTGRWETRRGWIGAVALLLAVGLFHPVAAVGGEPTEQIRGAIDRGLAIVKRADLQGETKKAQRRGLLRKELFPYFHFAEMSRQS